MHKNKKPRKGLAIAITLVFFVLVPYLFLAEHPFGIKPSKKMTEENIDSLKKVLPIEMYDFLFHNDSLKICLNSMAGYSYRSKAMTVYDSIIPESYVQYRYNWNNALKKWMMESRYNWRFDTAGNFLGTVAEEYKPSSQSWIVTRYDSLFYKDNVKYSSKSLYEGSYELEVSDDGNIETKIWEPIYTKDIKIIEYKKLGKLTKLEEYSRPNQTVFDEKWVLKYVKTYNSTENSSHTRTYYPNDVDSALRYDLHIVSSSLNDSISIFKKYNIDHLKHEILIDSTIFINREDNCNTERSFLYNKSGKLVQYYLDSIYYDADSNRYSLRKYINYTSGDGSISFIKRDNHGEVVHHKWHSWDRDSSMVHKREELKYYLPNYNYSISFTDEQTERDEQRFIENIGIEFTPDQYNSCETSLFWSVEDECYRVLNIELEKYNKNGKVIESIRIQ